MKSETLLRETPGLRSRSLASELGEDRSQVNSALHANGDRFFQDSEFQWFSGLTARIEGCGRHWSLDDRSRLAT